MQQGDILELQITGLGAQGDGLTRSNDTPVFVPYALPGETVRARLTQKRGDSWRAVPEEIVSAGADRAVPPCAHFSNCGGCALQHMTPTAYQTFKLDQLQQILARAGLHPEEMVPLISPPIASRRRVTLTAVGIAGGAVLGYSAAGSHHVVDVESCAIARPEIAALIPPLRAALAGVLRQGERVQVLVTHTATGADVLIRPDSAGRKRSKGRQLAGDALARLTQHAVSTGLARLAWDDGRGPEVIVQQAPPEIAFDGIAVTPPMGAFLQASEETEAALRAEVQQACMGAKQIADLYAGTGTFALPLGRTAQVLAVDVAGDHVDALEQAAKRAGGLKPLTALARDLAKQPLSAQELKRFEAVVLDPPRAGALAQTEALAASDVPVIAYVSCHPQNFARDAAILTGAGYRLTRLTPVDQFVFSPHLELCGVFQRT